MCCFNTGLASGRVLLSAWSADLADILDRRLPALFTCANDWGDGRGEAAVMRAGLCAAVAVPLRKNPFGAVTTLHAPGRRHDAWSSANSFVHGVRGWAPGGEGRPPAEALRGRLEKVADALGLQAQRAW